MFLTLSELQELISRKIERQGAETPVAAFIFDEYSVSEVFPEPTSRSIGPIADRVLERFGNSDSVKSDHQESLEYFLDCEIEDSVTD